MFFLRNFFQNPYIALLLTGGVIYLILIPQMGYFNDDWYLMYAAGTKGATVFQDIFIIDRPMRAWVMMPAYALFGNNPILYNLSALLFRFLSASIFYWSLILLWEKHKKIAWVSALLFFIYPGFLSQFNGIDYQSQMVSLTFMMLSFGLIIRAYQNKQIHLHVLSFFVTTFVTTFYLGLVEYFIGMEVLKIAVLAMLVFRDENMWAMRIKKTLQWGLYSGLTATPFLIWRLFFFESQRGATDIDFKLGGFLSDPFAFLANWAVTLIVDITEVIFGAYFQPLQRLSHGFTFFQWFIGIIITAIVLFAVWVFLKKETTNEITKNNHNWKIEATWLGIVMVVFGLFPVILVGREVDFKSFSRYALAPSVGVVLLWQAGLGYINSQKLKNFFLFILITLSSLTHYANGLTKAQETQATRDFWWQVSWRIPQLGTGTTLIAHYAVAAEEDYFTWGPANLIYYPESDHEKYVQPAIYALLLSDDNAIEKIIAKEGQDYSERRSIRTYPNYRNILILTQPTPQSCMQVIDLRQVEISSYEDERVKQIADYSEADQIVLDSSFQTPPMIPFGSEPEHGWCYYYEKASYARQVEDWNQVSTLGEAVFNQGLVAQDQIEWMPFVQAYAHLGNINRLKQIAEMMSADVGAMEQACKILGTMESAEAKKLFCVQ